MKAAFNYGTIGGVLVFAYFVLLEILGFEGLGTLSLFGVVILILVNIKALKQKIKESDSFSYLQGLKTCLFIGLVYSSLFGMLLYLYGTFGDTAFLESFKNNQLEEIAVAEEQFKNLLGEKMLELQIKQIKELTMSQAAGSAFFSKVMGGVLVGFILPFFHKKSPDLFKQ